jgi:hypothetical protein
MTAEGDESAMKLRYFTYYWGKRCMLTSVKGEAPFCEQDVALYLLQTYDQMARATEGGQPYRPYSIHRQ